MKLIIGLGNPGKKYESSRHNVGFRIAEVFAKGLDWKMSEKFQAMIAENKPDDIIVKPMTFMNNSGEAVSKLIRFYKLDPSADILVISDDKDMAFGKLRERSEGSSGGHNGLKSIAECLGTENFHRLKFGVGHEDQSIPTDAFVLQPFSKEEEEQMPKIIEEAEKRIIAWMKEIQAKSKTTV